MIRRKYREHFRHVLGLAIVALLLNLTIPNTKPVKAEMLSTPDVPVAVTQPISLPALPTIVDKPVTVKKTMTVRASAYTSSRAETDNNPFTTASGTKVRDGIIAANGLPFGTKVRIREINKDKIFVVQDRMNARWGNRKIDIWMVERHQALEWGVRTVTLEIVK